MAERFIMSTLYSGYFGTGLCLIKFKYFIIFDFTWF